jgi:hypothetical protein
MKYVEQVRAHAAKLGISVHALFIGAGVGYTNWERWRNGKTSPRVKNLDALLSYNPKAAKPRPTVRPKSRTKARAKANARAKKSARRAR